MKKIISLITVFCLMAMTMTPITYAADGDTVPSNTDTSSTDSSTEENSYTYGLSGQYFKDSTGTYYVRSLSDGEKDKAFTSVVVTDGEDEVDFYDVYEENEIKSSNTKVLDIDEDGNLYAVSEGKANIADKNGILFNIEVASYENFFKKLYEIAGQPVLVAGSKEYNSDNFRAKYSLYSAPEMSFKIKKNGKYETIANSNWKITVGWGDGKVSADGNVTKAEGETGFIVKYIDTKSNIEINGTNIYTTFYNTDTTKVGITTGGGEGSERGSYINVDTANGKQLITTLGNEIFFFYDDGNYNQVFDDVTIKVADEKIASEGDFVGGLITKAVGTTTATLTGKSIKDGKQVVTITVVKDIYEYKNEHPELFPDDFKVIKYEYNEGKNYEKINEDLLKTCDILVASVRDDGIVSSSVFETLKKYENKKLIIDSTKTVDGKYYYASWTFDSNTINSAINFIPAVVTSSTKFSNIESDEFKDGIFVDFAHNGELPGKATVKFDVPNDLFEKYYSDEEKTLYVYYYNPDTKDYEYETEAKCKYGALQFEIEHCSQYYISDTKLEGKRNRGDLDDEPKTGSENYINIAAILALISIAGIGIIKRK